LIVTVNMLLTRILLPDVIYTCCSLL